ncbi:unnamed protein product [Amoebophrya sp. A25]|nr:unnamed protein product [Amoebophrya sp. A25]|eukprot:GSA25T00020532001.1
MSTAGISLKATQADGFYFPPDWDPSKGSLDSYQRKKGFEHALGKNRVKNLDKGILQIRFELPFKIQCLNCEDMIGQGTRFDADKKRVGNYYTTPIYEFRMRCGQIVDPSVSVDGKTHCNCEWVIQTDPQNADYALVAGCVRPGKTTGFRNSKDLAGHAAQRDGEQATELDPLYMDTDARREMAQDPMFRLEMLAKRTAERAGIQVDNVGDQGALEDENNNRKAVLDDQQEDVDREDRDERSSLHQRQQDTTNSKRRKVMLGVNEDVSDVKFRMHPRESETPSWMRAPGVRGSRKKDEDKERLDMEREAHQVFKNAGTSSLSGSFHALDGFGGSGSGGGSSSGISSTTTGGSGSAFDDADMQQYIAAAEKKKRNDGNLKKLYLLKKETKNDFDLNSKLRGMFRADRNREKQFSSSSSGGTTSGGVGGSAKGSKEAHKPHFGLPLKESDSEDEEELRQLFMMKSGKNAKSSSSTGAFPGSGSGSASGVQQNYKQYSTKTTSSSRTTGGASSSSKTTTSSRAAQGIGGPGGAAGTSSEMKEALKQKALEQRHAGLAFEKQLQRRKLLNAESIIPRSNANGSGTTSRGGIGIGSSQQSSVQARMNEKFALFKQCQSQAQKNRNR